MDSTKKKVCLLVTSQHCGHCIKLRNKDGKILPFAENQFLSVYGKHSYNYDFIKNILTVENKYSDQEWVFMNVHIVPNGHSIIIGSISFFTIIQDKKNKKEYIEQMIFEPLEIEENEVKKTITLRESHVISRDKFSPELSKSKHNTKIEWKLTMKELIPNLETIVRFAPYMPCVLFYNDENREKHSYIDGGQDRFYAKTMALETSKKPPYHAVKSNNITDMDVMKNLNYYDENPEFLNPIITISLQSKIQTAYNTRQR